MSLTRLQRRVLEVIRSNRSPESYVAGGAALNRAAFRLSDDIDIFHERESAIAAQAEQDLKALREAGLLVSVSIIQYGLVEALVKEYGEETMIQWMDDTIIRFFPIVEDPLFGFRLHDADLAVNKVLAGASRARARDAVDLARLHREYLPLGYLVWAAAGKTVLSPDELAENIVRNAISHGIEAFDTVRTNHPFDARDIVRALMRARDEALALSGHLPIASYGQLFLDRDSNPVAATPEMIGAGDVVAHGPRARGVWPVFPGMQEEIDDTMPHHRDGTS